MGVRRELRAPVALRPQGGLLPAEQPLHQPGQQDLLRAGLFCHRLERAEAGQEKGLPQDACSFTEDERAWLPQGFNPLFGKYTPNNVLTDQTKTKIEVLGKPIEIQGAMKKDFGLQLRQLAQAPSAYELEVRTRVVDEEMKDEVITRELAKNLAAAGDYVPMNYHRKTLGQKGRGHISPLGAYDEASDSFLIMDVNPNRAPWVWVSAAHLIKAMRTFDTVVNRGYLLIAEGR